MWFHSSVSYSILISESKIYGIYLSYLISTAISLNFLKQSLADGLSLGLYFNISVINYLNDGENF